MRVRWLPLILWTGLILSASGGAAGSNHTGGPLEALVEAIGLSLSSQQFYWLHVAMRKMAHVVAYGTEGAFAFLALGATIRRRALKAFAIAVIVATIDELHQSTVPTRTGSPYDVCIDAAAAGATVALLRAFAEGRNRRAGAFPAP